MKIDFGPEIKASINSLNDRLNSITNQYMLVVRGSQVMLRARLQRYPDESSIIHEMLSIKDLDIQLEPVNEKDNNEEVFQKVTTLMQSILLKKNTKGDSLSVNIPVTNTYAHLPKSGVSKGAKNKVDSSVQRYKIEACMNIDQKVDAYGNILFLNEEHKHDFEDTYLNHNLIKFYNIDDINWGDYLERNKMAFRLKKCLSPEVKNFKSLLDEQTAIQVKKLFEDPSLLYPKSQILRMLQNHYKKDPAQAESEIRDLYLNSIQHASTMRQQEIESLEKTISQQHDVVKKAIDYIEANSQDVHNLSQRLSHIMASSSSPTLPQIHARASALNEFKNDVMMIYDAVEKEELRQQALKTVNIAISPPSVQREIEAAKPKPNSNKKKAKNKAKTNEIKEEPPEDLDAVLKEAKLHYPKLTLADEFKILASKYEQAFSTLAVMSDLPESNFTGDKAVLMCSSLMLELINSVKSNKLVEQSFMDFRNFYFMNFHESDSLSKLEALKTHIKPGEPYLRAIHDFMMLAFRDPAPAGTPSQLKKAIACVRNHRESKDQSIDLVVRSILNIVIEKGDAAKNFIALFMAAVSFEMKHVMEKGNEGKLIDQIGSLLSLFCRGAIYQHFKNESDLIEIGFFNTLAKEMISHRVTREKFSNLFVQFFINKTIASFILRRGQIESNHFAMMLAYSGVSIAKYIFPGDGVENNHLLVASIMTNFSDLLPALKTFYSIISISVPTVSHEFEHKFMLNSPEVCAFSKSSRPTLDDLRGIIKSTIDVVAETSSFLEEHLEASAAQCYRFASLCMNHLLESPEFILGERFKTHFTNKLSTSEVFKHAVKEIADERKSSLSSPSNENIDFMLAVTQQIVITDQIQLIDPIKIDLPKVSQMNGLARRYELESIADEITQQCNTIDKVLSAAMQLKHPQACQESHGNPSSSRQEDPHERLMSLINNPETRESLSHHFMRHFIERAAFSIYTTYSPLACSVATQTAIESVLQLVFKSSDYLNDELICKDVVLNLSSAHRNIYFNIMMLTVVKPSLTPNITFTCEAPIKKDDTPAKAFAFGIDEYSRESIMYVIQRLLEDIAGIRKVNEQANAKSRNVILDVAYIAIEILSKNMGFLYENNFNEKFSDLLNNDINYIRHWSQFCLSQISVQAQESTSTFSTLYENYKNEFVSLTSKMAKSSQQNSSPSCKM